MCALDSRSGIRIYLDRLVSWHIWSQLSCARLSSYCQSGVLKRLCLGAQALLILIGSYLSPHSRLHRFCVLGLIGFDSAIPFSRDHPLLSRPSRSGATCQCRGTPGHRSPHEALSKLQLGVSSRLSTTPFTVAMWCCPRDPAGAVAKS